MMNEFHAVISNQRLKNASVEISLCICTFLINLFALHFNTSRIISHINIVYFQPTGGAPVGDDTVSFDEMIHKLSDTMERFKALYDSRKGMIETLLSHEEGTEAWDIARITLRSMTGELKEIADEINMITTKMATLRDKKHEARISSRSEALAAGEAEKELGVDLA